MYANKSLFSRRVMRAVVPWAVILLLALGLVSYPGPHRIGAAPLSGPAGTLLADGRELRWLDTGGAVLRDPATGRETAIEALAGLWRRGQSTTLLPDGRVLIAGGMGADGAADDRALLWTPASGAVERLAMPQPVEDTRPDSPRPAACCSNGRSRTAG